MRQENRIRNAFDCIEASRELKVSTKEFLRDARQRENRRSMGKRRSGPAWRLALGTACAVLTLFLCIGGYGLLWMPVAYVSIDVNPSLELELNRLDRVISGRAYNEDGERILESVSVKGMYYEDAIESIVASERMQPYLTEDGGLTFTVATDRTPTEVRLLADIARTSGCLEHGGISVRADMSLVGEAHDNGLSLGQYRAYQILLRYEPDLMVQDCHEMSMSQIHGRIEEHEHGRNHGNGHGGGHEVDDRTEPETGYEIEDKNDQQTEQLPERGRGHHGENGHGRRSGHGH